MDLGHTVSHFELLERIGRGGMALVYKARDVRLGRLVALKLLAPGMETREEARLRFLLEARAISALDHPNVCTLYETGETADGRMFLVMAYADGGTLRDRLAQGPLEPLEAVLLAAQIAEGLGAAHARGIVHRDIKPGNLLLGNGLVKIADFGVARLADQAPITRDGQALGTWSYMSPEQVNGKEVTPAADLWSLGVVLFEMVTGKRPFRGKSEPELIRRILETTPPPLGVGGPQLARIVARALEKSPERRYASAREMQDDLLEAAEALAGGEEDTWQEPVAPVSHVRLEPPRLHNLPFAPLGDLLKGRSEELHALAQALAEDGSPHSLVIHGLGGIGKTRLAVEHAWRFGRRYQAALFVLADSPDGLNSGLAALARTDLLDLPERNLPAESEVIGAVLRWLRENPGWLLILDNVDTREARLAVTKLLPALTAGRVLITSRRRDWPAGVRRQAVDRVLLQPAAEFLLERSRPGRTSSIPRPLSRNGVMQYPAPLAVTWQRSFQQLAPTAQAILRLASFLAPDPIPAAMLDSGDQVVHKAAARLWEETGQAEAPATVRDNLAELRALSLISGQGEVFTVHRLMQEVVRSRVPAEVQTAWNELAMQWVESYGPPNADDASTWPIWDLLRPHAFQAVAHAAELGAAESFSRLMLTTQLGMMLYAKGLYTEAEPLMRRALEIAEKLHGRDSIDIAIRLTNLGMLLKVTGRPQDAEPLLRKAVEIFFRPGERPDDATRALNVLALILMERKRFPEAESLLRKALAIDEESGDQPLIAVGLHNLALLLGSVGRPVEAEPVIRRSLEISRQIYGDGHPRTARKMQILAGILRDLGRPEEAESLFRQALSTLEDVLGQDHPWTRSARHELDTLTAA